MFYNVDKGSYTPRLECVNYTGMVRNQYGLTLASGKIVTTSYCPCPPHSPSSSYRLLVKVYSTINSPHVDTEVQLTQKNCAYLLATPRTYKINLSTNSLNHELSSIRTMGRVIEINHFTTSQCLHRPRIKCSTEPQSSVLRYCPMLPAKST